ncbi:secretion protein EspA [Arsenophonus sp. ENCA]|uniref:secretion protein EspA n=1 Tax=Arsenophonus sp. ENCA TaxID=1987579 RepID=UPI000BC95E1C|nr:secretion protein EspA [Arsenophonus sp. ENCA]PAV07253.1 secretion protein EspA [Arsenophonus sp. ENCA]
MITSSVDSFSSNAISGSYSVTHGYKEDPILSQGIEILYTFMNLLSDLANEKYLEMKKRADFSRDSQEMANRVDEIIAKVEKEGDKAKAEIPDHVRIFMEKNNITVDGKNINDYAPKGQALDQGQLQSVKAAIKTLSDRASDFVSQSQLQIQKVMQTYNVTVSLLNSMQTMLGEMNKSIAQNIR